MSNKEFDTRLHTLENLYKSYGAVIPKSIIREVYSTENTLISTLLRLNKLKLLTHINELATRQKESEAIDKNLQTKLDSLKADLENQSSARKRKQLQFQRLLHLWKTELKYQKKLENEITRVGKNPEKEYQYQDFTIFQDPQTIKKFDIQKEYELTELDKKFDKTILNGSYAKKFSPKNAKVMLEKNKIKGWGLYAKTDIKNNTVVALYKVIAKTKFDTAVKNGRYSIDLEGRNRNTLIRVYGDIYEGSLMKPQNGKIPYWGYFANEPNLATQKNQSQTMNVTLIMDTNSYYKNKKSEYRLKAGDIWTLKLKTIRDVKKTEELTWCYGDTYSKHREYKGKITYIPNCTIDIEYSIDGNKMKSVLEAKPYETLNDVLFDIETAHKKKPNLYPSKKIRNLYPSKELLNKGSKSIYEIYRNYVETKDPPILELFSFLDKEAFEIYIRNL